MSGYFVPAVVGAAIVTAIVWATVGPEPRMAHAIINAVAVLIIACPVRARPRDADVNHGRDRKGRDDGRVVQERRGDRSDAEGRHARRRQDGHPHGGEAEADDRHAGAGVE